MCEKLLSFTIEFIICLQFALKMVEDEEEEDVITSGKCKTAVHDRCGTTLPLTSAEVCGTDVH